jgi:glyoxylase-like metal-dependent hydrolase (beta-lactamase superfamily II)
MTIQVKQLVLGPMQTNCYIVGDTASGDAVVIDPVDSADTILRAAQDAGWTIREILATHAHFDHIMASARLKELTGAPFRLHERDVPLLRAMPESVRLWTGHDVPPAAEPDGVVSEGDTITVGAMAFDVLFTPGHSPGHVSFVLRDGGIVFSGDVLFRGSIGRTDLPGADYDTLMDSIVTRLLPLGDAMTVAPGHMETTTIGFERQNNPFVIEYLREREGD